MTAIEYIPREAVLARQRRIELVHHTADSHERIGMDVVQVRDIEEIPAANVFPVVRGEWLFTSDITPECSRCRSRNGEMTLYCPRCGAYMEDIQDG